MGPCQLANELRRHGIELRLNQDRSRLGVAKGQLPLLTPELSRAIQEEYHYLIRGELLKAAARDFNERLTSQAGLCRGDPEYRAAYTAIGEGLPDDFLAASWGRPLEEFRSALEDYFAPGYTALEEAFDREALAHSDEPALFGTASTDGSQDLQPAADRALQ